MLVKANSRSKNSQNTVHCTSDFFFEKIGHKYLQTILFYFQAQMYIYIHNDMLKGLNDLKFLSQLNTLYPFFLILRISILRFVWTVG